MKAICRLEEIERWEEFISSLTVEWLLDNTVYQGPSIVRDGIFTHSEEFSIMWEGQRFTCTNPPQLRYGAQVFMLSSNQEMSLSKCLPVDVMNDFVRMVEL